MCVAIVKIRKHGVNPKGDAIMKTWKITEEGLQKCAETDEMTETAANANRFLHTGLLLVAVIVGFTSQAAATSHDVAWTFGDFGTQSYVLDSFTPIDADLGPLSAQDPTLTLRLGKRYQVTVNNFVFHPLDIIAKGAGAATDTVLLSMGGSVGTFESDSEVDWADNGSGTVTFTMTMSLYSAMIGPGQNPGYRCRTHTTTMRGDFAVVGMPFVETIPKGAISIELEVIASGLASPVDFKPAADGTGRLFIIDQEGKVRIVQGGVLLPTVFLDVTGDIVSPLGFFGTFDVNDFDERGLLGMALHPDFADPAGAGFKKLYTYTSEPNDVPSDFTTDPPPLTINHHTVIAEWTVSADPNVVDPASKRELMRIVQPQFNHDGGMVAFGPDGFLYISLGDGGAANDVADGHGATGNGQNKDTVHGSILRIDPLSPAATPLSTDPVSANGSYRIPADNPFVGSSGVDEIYAYGFRNPYRFSFDTATGELIVGDVGQDHLEEIDIVEKGGNYGWNLKEGSFLFDPATGNVSNDLTGLPAGLLDPVAEYDHDDGISVIGGFIYRGTAIPELWGKYVFGDFSVGFFDPGGRIFYADLDTGEIHEFIIGVDDIPLGLFMKGLGQDSAGEIYLLASPHLGPYGTGGVVLKIVDLCTERLAGDIDKNCLVNFADFALLASDWLRDVLR